MTIKRCGTKHKDLENSNLPSHLMARYGHKEQVGLIGILRPEAALADVLEEVPLAGVLPSQLPRCLEVRIRIPIRVDKNLKFPLHLRVVLQEDVRGVVDRGRGQHPAGKIAGNFGHSHLQHQESVTLQEMKEQKENTTQNRERSSCYTSSTSGEGNWGDERRDLRERRLKQIRVRAATARRERWIEQAAVAAEGSGFPAIGRQELSAKVSRVARWRPVSERRVHKDGGEKPKGG